MIEMDSSELLIILHYSVFIVLCNVLYVACMSWRYDTTSGMYRMMIDLTSFVVYVKMVGTVMLESL